MRVLIDSCLPVQFAAHFHFPVVMTARDMGWQNMKNGKLLSAAENSFDALVTMDKHIPNQQFLKDFSIGVLIVRARSNRLCDLLPLVSEITRRIPLVRKGTVQVVSDL